MRVQSFSCERTFLWEIFYRHSDTFILSWWIYHFSIKFITVELNRVFCSFSGRNTKSYCCFPILNPLFGHMHILVHTRFLKSQGDPCYFFTTIIHDLFFWIPKQWQLHLILALFFSVEQKLEAIYVLLEAFGNVSTVLNHSATRFTLLFSMDFDSAGLLTCAAIQVQTTTGVIVTETEHENACTCMTFVTRDVLILLSISLSLVKTNF